MKENFSLRNTYMITWGCGPDSDIVPLLLFSAVKW
jgi:hypothetical protein